MVDVLMSCYKVLRSAYSTIQAPGMQEAGRVQQFGLGRRVGRDREDGAVRNHAALRIWLSGSVIML